jgi:hypothetical protein
MSARHASEDDDAPPTRRERPEAPRDETSTPLPGRTALEAPEPDRAPSPQAWPAVEWW